MKNSSNIYMKNNQKFIPFASMNHVNTKVYCVLYWVHTSKSLSKSSSNLLLERKMEEESKNGEEGMGGFGLENREVEDQKYIILKTNNFLPLSFHLFYNY